MGASASGVIYELKITLKGIRPPIWRRIQVPADHTFWDLHVAIQDAMGWLDYHLHAFRIPGSHGSRPLEIGIPGEGREEVVPGWTVPISELLTRPGQKIAYDYDFGDSWKHWVLLEDILPKQKDRYPRCIAGKRACPPEDCGGVPGYCDLLEVMGDPACEAHQRMVDWLKGHAKNYFPYDPEKFQPEQVRFDDPRKRWRRAFS